MIRYTYSKCDCGIGNHGPIPVGCKESCKLIQFPNQPQKLDLSKCDYVQLIPLPCMFGQYKKEMILLYIISLLKASSHKPSHFLINNECTKLFLPCSYYHWYPDEFDNHFIKKKESPHKKDYLKVFRWSKEIRRFIDCGSYDEYVEQTISLNSEKN
jgi:hypothetical protein